MEKKIYKCTVCLLLGILVLFAAAAGIVDRHIPDSISVIKMEELPDTACVSYVDCGVAPGSDGNTHRLSAKLFGVIPVKQVEAKIYGERKLCPGGMPFGVKLASRGVIVVGLSRVVGADKVGVKPAEDAGLKIKDIILKINGHEITSNADVGNILSGCNGAPLELTCRREGKEISIKLTPVKAEDGSWRMGVWLRDSMSGIGTVTFVDPETKAFGGLGHGVCDVDTGELLPLRSGSAMGAKIVGITKGKEGAPGELRGYLKGERIGKIVGNTACGVFGYLSEELPGLGEALPIATKHQVKEGEAYILSTVDDGGVKRYTVSISAIDLRGETKCFSVKVTDPELLSKTGGIVQGMSGSPIIQDGRIIGAVTHVLVSDPTSGYGIFIENMLANS